MCYEPFLCPWFIFSLLENFKEEDEEFEFEFGFKTLFLGCCG